MMKYKIQILIFLLIISNILSFIGYFKCEIFCANDYADYLITSEGIIPPVNPYKISHRDRNYYYVYNFTYTKHNFDKDICLQLVNIRGAAGFAFKFVSINEYDITSLKSENYYHCDNCNIAVPQKFQTTTTLCVDKPFISTGNVGNIYLTTNNTFCLNANENISLFYIDESKIIQNFYKGNTLDYIFNEVNNTFDIDKIFSINGYNDFEFFLDSVSLKIINIENKNGKIFNGDEELFKDSFFNAKNKTLLYIKENDDGYLMTISIASKPRNKNITTSTCESEAKINLYISQKNCTINETSNNFCQHCINNEYGKNLIENKCYHKTEKLTNLYFEESTRLWNPCETNKFAFICSICPKGTFILDIDSQFCEQCPKGYYSSNEDQDKCEKCPEGYYADSLGQSECKKCPDGYTSLKGAFECYRDCDAGYYASGDECIACSPGFFSLPSSTHCSECIPGTYTDKEGMDKCLICKPGTYNNEYKAVKCINCPSGSFSFLNGATECFECIPGTYTNEEGMTECLKCQPGTYNNLYKQDKCINCPIGYYASLEGSIECTQCPLGTFNALIKSDHCEDCDIGYYNDRLGSSQCKICPLNYYSDEKGLTYCKLCEDNKYSLLGFSQCQNCEEIIPHCNICSKEMKCLQCNNKALNGFNNCTICENDVDWEFTGEYCKLITICDNYYYKDKNNNNKIHCINDDILECPEGMDYLNLDTGECKSEAKIQDFISFQYKVKGGADLLNTVSDNIFFEYRQFPEVLDEYLTKNKIQIKGIKSNLQIGYSENLKKPDDSNIGIDFGDCPYILRTRVEVKRPEQFDNLYKVIDLEMNGTTIVNYSVHNTYDLTTPVNLSVCENQTVTIVSPPYDYLDYFEDAEMFEGYAEIVREGLDVFNAYSPLYTDPCFPLTMLNKYDLTLRDRRNYIGNRKIPICEDGCEYEGDNFKNFTIICYCKIKVDMTSKPLINVITSGFADIESRNNLEVLKCYKLNFSIKGQRYNFFSYIFILFLLGNVTIIIITEIYLKDSLEELIKHCKWFIDKNNCNEKEKFNTTFIKLRQIYLKKKLEVQDEKELIYFKRFIDEKINHNPPKKHSIKNIGSTETLEESGQIRNESTFNKNNTENKQISLTLIKRNGQITYYNAIIFSYLKIMRTNFLIDEELNDLDYEYYRHIENRKWYAIFFSLFKEKYDFIETFFIYNRGTDYKDYKLYGIKIMIYLNSIIVSIIINIMFYTDETMHKIMEDDGEYNPLYRLPRILISDISQKIISYLLSEFIDFQDNFIELKINLDEANEKEYKNIKDSNYDNKKNTESENYNNVNTENKSLTLTLKNNRIKYSSGNEENNSRSPLKKRTIKNYKASKNTGGKENKETNENEIKNENKKEENENISKNDKKIENSENASSKDEIIEKIKKSFKWRRIIFYIIIIILGLFSWYYASCFCAIYKKTQKHLYLDFLFSIPMSLGSCFISCFFILLTKLLIKAGEYSCIKKWIGKIFGYEFISLIIEIIIELFIVNIFT